MTNTPGNSQEVFEIIEKIRNVPRGTFLKLEIFVELLLKWNSKINLVGKNTEPELWARHVLDSAQLYKYIPESAETLVDVGTGAGFPGIILKLLGFPHVTLIESDERKCTFLKEAIRVTELKDILVTNARIESVGDKKFDLITCRAIASLDQILNLTFKFNKNESLNLFLKGSSVQKELDDAFKNWDFDFKLYPSITSENSFVIAISKLRAKP